MAPVRGTVSITTIKDSRPSPAEEREAGVVRLLQHLWTFAITTKADMAREGADCVAEAASKGFITTAVIPNGSLHGRLWKVTPEGLAYLYANADAVADEEAHYVERYA